MSSDARENDASVRKLFFLSVLLFVVVKLLMVWLPVHIMGGPRLGDDAFVYLWWGENSLIDTNSPAIRDVLNIHHLNIYSSFTDFFFRDRVTMRVTGSTISPVLLAIGGLVRTGDPNFLFAVQESVVALTLAAGLGLFLRYYFGYGPAAIGLFLLTFVFLPKHGIHWLVPSVMALAFSLMLFVQASKERPNLVVVFLVAGCLLVAHQIGFIYFCIAGALNILKSAVNRRLGKANINFVVALLVASTIAVFLYVFIKRIPEAEDGRGVLNFTNAVVNLIGFVKTWIKKPVGLILLVLGAIAYIRLGFLRSPATLLLGLVGAAIIASLFYNLPGYPGDIADRLFIIFVVVACGAIGAAIVSHWGNKKVRLAVVILSIGHAALGSVLLYKHIYTVANSRYQVFDFAKLRQTLLSIDPQKPVAYADAEIALMSSLIAGGYRYGAFPIHMIPKAEDLKKQLTEAKPGFLAILPPRSLSGYAGLRSHTLSKRFYGYAFDRFRGLDVQSESGFKDFIFFRMEGLNGKDEISVSGQSAGDGQPANCRTPQIERMPSGNWYRVGYAGCEYSKITVESRSSSLSVTGFSVTTPDEQADWPWGNKVSLSAWPKRGRTPLLVDFSWEGLFKDSKIERLNDSLVRAPVFITDQGGIIFAKIEVK